MKNAKLKSVRNKLLNSIKELSDMISLFVQNPEKDFSRNRKLPPETIIKSILAMGGGSLANELLNCFNCSIETPSTSAFVQQRAKIKYNAFETLFKDFTNAASCSRLYKGYRLMAVDGSDIHCPTDKNDDASFYPGTNGQKPYNLLHLNAIYDLCENIYVDAIVQKSHDQNEHKAFVTMVDRYTYDTPTIFIGDRGYEAYNNMAHVQQKGQFFLFRIKSGSSHCMIKGFDLPDEDEFDLSFDLSLSRKQTADMKELYKDKNKYRFLPSKATFDFLPKTSRKHIQMTPYELHFRIVKFKLTDDTYEIVATNLDKNQFPPMELKKLYNMRWGIETSFRALKYTIGLLHFHSKKADFVIQEIFAGLTMYNYSELIIAHIVIKKKDRKYDYKVNFAVAVHICRKCFLNNMSPPEIEALISRYIIPIRPDRKNNRNIAVRQAISFTYRIS